jgi:DNA-binding transcriptional LysR family regulator
MNLKQLRQVLVLAETLNFRVAAEQLHMAQPPLSESIRKLEEEIGVRLFERSRAGVELSQAGKSVLEHARCALYHAEQFRQAALLSVGGHLGTLRIHYVASSTINLLPRAIAHFRSVYPTVDLRLVEASTDAIMRALVDGRSDVGVVRFPTPNLPSVVVRAVEKNRYVAALPKTHSKANAPKLRLKDLCEENFIFPAHEMGSSGAYLSTMMACQQAGFVPNIVQQATHAQSIIALVESGLGVALVPNIWENLASKHTVFKPLTGMKDDVTGLAFACRKVEKESVLIKNFFVSVMHAVTKHNDL